VNLNVFSTYFISLKINGETNVSRVIKNTKINQLQEEAGVKERQTGTAYK